MLISVQNNNGIYIDKLFNSKCARAKHSHRQWPWAWAWTFHVHGLALGLARAHDNNLMDMSWTQAGSQKYRTIQNSKLCLPVSHKVKDNPIILLKLIYI